MAKPMNKPIHVAIVRRVRPGNEADFQQALREFIQVSFTHEGVIGAGMIVPPSGPGARDYGILRTFASQQERDSFYESALYQEWNERCKAMTEGEPEYRQLTGLEAWFRNPQSEQPPVWKMAVATYLGVLPVVMFLALTLGRLIRSWNFVANNIVFNAFVVALLTWVVMPAITKVLDRWLHGEYRKMPVK